MQPFLQVQVMLNLHAQIHAQFFMTSKHIVERLIAHVSSGLSVSRGQVCALGQ